MVYVVYVGPGHGDVEEDLSPGTSSHWCLKIAR